MKKLRDFIYLDTDYLTSVWSQVNDGNLISWLVEETSQEQSSSELHTDGTQHKVTANLGVLKSEIGAGFERESSIFAQTEIAKKAFSLALSDDIFDKVCSELDKQKLIASDASSAKVGQYVFLDGANKMIDIGFFSEMFSDGTSPLSKTEVDLEGLDSKMTIKQIIDLVSVFVPSDIIIQYSNYISYLKKQFLREKIMSVGFKYSDKYVLFGKVTKKGIPSIKKDAVAGSLLNSVEDMKEATIATLNQIGFSFNKQTYTVMPMAIYLE